jgi:hypothetical protein
VIVTGMPMFQFRSPVQYSWASKGTCVGMKIEYARASLVTEPWGELSLLSRQLSWWLVCGSVSCHAFSFLRSHSYTFAVASSALRDDTVPAAMCKLCANQVNYEGTEKLEKGELGTKGDRKKRQGDWFLGRNVLCTR